MLQSRLAIAILLILLAVGILALVGLYDAGYRFSGLRILSPSTVTVVGLPEDAVMHLDGREIAGEQDDQGTRTFLASAESHDIIVTRGGYWPWEKEIFPEGGGNLVIRPLLLPRETVATILETDDPKRRTIIAAISSSRVPTATSPLRAPDGSVSLYVRESELVASAPEDITPPPYFCRGETCDTERVILAFEAEMRDVAFMPGRPDIALLATQNGIFALELDSRGIQNFQPIYKGTRPRLAVLDDTLFVQDGDLIFSASLE